jgi:hypothetical protein
MSRFDEIKDRHAGWDYVSGAAAHNDRGELIAMVEAAEKSAVTIKTDKERQTWIQFDAGEGRKALLNLNGIVLDLNPKGITRGICCDALRELHKELKP